MLILLTTKDFLLYGYKFSRKMKLIARISSTCSNASCRSRSYLSSPPCLFSNPQIITIRSQMAAICLGNCHLWMENYTDNKKMTFFWIKNSNNLQLQG